MSRVAWHNQDVGSEALQANSAFYHLGNRVFAMVDDRVGSVGNLRVAVDTDSNMLLIAAGVGDLYDLLNKSQVASGPIPPRIPIVFRIYHLPRL